VSGAVGFAILAFAPTPLFAGYGLLTAVMIVIAAASTLLVLSSLLVAVAPTRVETEDAQDESESAMAPA
jgi:predicted RND superfamily exporter protein